MFQSYQHFGRLTFRSFPLNKFAKSKSLPSVLFLSWLELEKDRPPKRRSVADVKMYYWLVVSTHLKNISQIGNLPQIGVIFFLETTT